MALIIFDHFTVILIISIGLVAYSFSFPKQLLETETTTETFFGHSSSPEQQSAINTRSISDGYGTVSTVDGIEISESMFMSHSVSAFKTHQSAAENDQTSKRMTLSTKRFPAASTKIVPAASTKIVPAAKNTPKPRVVIIGKIPGEGEIGDQSDTNITVQQKLGTDDAFFKQVTPFSSSSSYTIQSTYGIKCTSVEIDLTNNIQYCTDAFGNTYIISSPSPSTEQAYDDIYIQHDSNDSIRLIDIQHDQLLMMFCPNSVYCPEESKPVSLSNQCCIPCDCSNTCIDSGTCCLYKGHAKTEPEITTTRNQSNMDEDGETRLYENRTESDELAESNIKNSTVTSEQETTIYQNYTEVSERTDASSTDHAFAESEGRKSKFHERCVETLVGNDYTDIEIKTTHSYMLIQSCPEDSEIDMEARDKCIESTDTEMSDSVPFYSSRTKNNYRNIHCAKCNNDSHFGKQWDSYFTCSSEISTLPFRRSFENVNDISPILKRMGKCMIFWEPDTNTARYCVNQDRLISTCKRKDIAALCLQYYAPVRGRNGVYRNLYCLLCNEDSTKLVCDNKQNGTDLFVTKFLIGDVFLEAKTDNGIVQSETEVDEKCESGLVYDLALAECIQKRCAVTQIQIGGRCVSMLEHVSGIGLDYRFAVLFPSTHLPSEDIILNFVRMLSLLPGDEGNCVEKVLGSEAQDGRVSVHIQIVKRVKIFRDIQIDFRAFKEKIAQLNSRMLEEEAAVDVEITKTSLLAVNENLISFLAFSNKSIHVDCGREIAMSELQFCETVLLQNVTFSPNGTVVHSGSVAFVPGEYVAYTGDETLSKVSPKITKTNSVSVCYDMYVLRTLRARRRVPFNNLQNTDVSSGVISRLATGTLFCLYFQVATELLIILFYRHLFEA